MMWRRGSMCNSGECVEVTDGGDGRVWLRDSKQPDGQLMLTMPRAAFAEIVEAAKAGEFDSLVMRELSTRRRDGHDVTWSDL